MERERLFLIAHTLVGSLLFTVTIAAIILTIARFVLIDEYNRIKRDTSLVNVEHLRLEGSVEELNKKIRYADTLQQGFSKWSVAALKITELIPKGVSLDYLFLNRATGAIRLNGRAESREAFLAAKETLEKSQLFKSLEAPLSNLLEKSNIEFRFAGWLRDDFFISKLNSQ